MLNATKRQATVNRLRGTALITTRGSWGPKLVHAWGKTVRVCMWCKRVQNEDGAWILALHDRKNSSHIICPSCKAKGRGIWI